MAPNVTGRAENALFFPAPQRHANRPPRLKVQRAQDADRFERDDGSGAVVGGARAGDPTIEVPAQHHHLIFQRRVGTRNFSDHVAARFMVSIKLCRDIHAHRDRDAMRHQAEHAAKRLAGNDRRRNRLLVFRPVHEPAERETCVVMNHAARATRAKHGHRMFISEEVANFLKKGHLLKYPFPEQRIVRQHMTVLLIAVHGIRTEVIQLRLIVMLEKISRVRVDVRGITVKDDLAGELPFPFLKVFFVLQVGHRDHATADLARGGR